MAHAVLNEDWSYYDDKKKKLGDSSDFACTERWEVDYLVDKLKKHFPKKEEAAIRSAIEACCKQVGAPHPREKFVDCVVKRLSN